MSSNYENAGLFVILSGLLHIPVFLATGFAGMGLFMLIIGVIYILIGVTLRNKKPRWLAWLTYLIMLCGVLASLVLLGSGTLPTIWAFAIFLVDALAAIFLFRILWADKTLA